MFDWVCDRNSTSTNKLDISIARFGDGYEHRRQKSINPNITSFSLSFNNRELAYIQEIVDFLEEKGGVQAFYWKDPGTVLRVCPTGGDALRVVCNEWNTTVPVAGIQSLTATFNRVYN